MKLEEQVVGLELAKKLKKLGVKQESVFYWTKRHKTRRVELKRGNMPLGNYDGAGKHAVWLDGEMWSAFSVAELGEMLPDFVNCYKTSNEWAVWYGNLKEDTPQFHDLNLSNAMAKMLIWLIENKKVDAR